MAVLRISRIALASVVAVTTGASSMLTGCATFKAVPSDYRAREVSREPVSPLPVPPRQMNGRHIFFDNLLFDHGKSDLKPEAKAALDEVKAFLKVHPEDTLVITGHTSDPGEEAHNVQLGKRRAEKAKAYLVEQGIESGRLRVRSAGETEPTVPNSSAASRALNRRVVFHIDKMGSI